MNIYLISHNEFKRSNQKYFEKIWIKVCCFYKNYEFSLFKLKTKTFARYTQHLQKYYCYIRLEKKLHYIFLINLSIIMFDLYLKI